MSMMYQSGFDYEIGIKLLITLLGCFFELKGLCYELVPSLISNSRFLFMIAHFFICCHKKHLGTWHICFIGGSTTVVFIGFRQDFPTLQKISNMNFQVVLGYLILSTLNDVNIENLFGSRQIIFSTYIFCFIVDPNFYILQYQNYYNQHCINYHPSLQTSPYCLAYDDQVTMYFVIWNHNISQANVGVVLQFYYLFNLIYFVSHPHSLFCFCFNLFNHWFLSSTLEFQDIFTSMLSLLCLFSRNHLAFFATILPFSSVLHLNILIFTLLCPLFFLLFYSNYFL